jgi:hypothetical protein
MGVLKISGHMESRLLVVDVFEDQPSLLKTSSTSFLLLPIDKDEG